MTKNINLRLIGIQAIKDVVMIFDEASDAAI